LSTEKERTYPGVSVTTLFSFSLTDALAEKAGVFVPVMLFLYFLLRL